MNLTKTDKAAFVRAVMADVPEIDYDAEAQALLERWDREAMPEAIRAIWDTLPLRQYLALGRYHVTPVGLLNVSLVCLRASDLTPEQTARVAKLAEESLAQREKRESLADTMASTIAPFRTLAAAKKGLPEELHKYLPADRDATGVANLPAVASPVDLLKAMGWPK